MTTDSADASPMGDTNVMEQTFPPEIDIAWLLETNPKLAEAKDIRKWSIELGAEAGFAGSPMAHSQTFSAFLADMYKDKRILELGPGNFPRFTGSDTCYFDAKTPAELLDQYKKWKQPVDRIPEKIHYVEPHGNLTIIQDKFDLVFSSHNIEHVIDLVQHIKDVENILAPSGIFALCIPDKRYTFDYYRQVSGLENILAQYYQHTINHPLHAVLDFRLNMTHNRQKLHWAGNHGESPDHLNELSSILHEYDSAGFVDIHRWVFTRDSFVKCITALYKLKLISFRIIRCYYVPRDANGFNVILGK